MKCRRVVAADAGARTIAGVESRQIRLRARFYQILPRSGRAIQPGVKAEGRNPRQRLQVLSYPEGVELPYRDRVILMAGSYSQILLHIVFSTKERRPVISLELSPRLYAYMASIVRGEGGSLYEIGGAPDHVHLLLRWRADAALSDLMRNLKRNSSLWIHKTFPDLRSFRWQDGYGAFSVSPSQKEAVIRYIRGQETHHRRKTFQEEFIALLRAHGLDYNPDLIWK